jgi:hypothetical protein
MVRLCRGEYEPFQVVLKSTQAIKAVTVQFEGLPEGLTVECQPVGVVNIKKSLVRAGLTPDPLLNDPRFEVPANRNQSFWVTLHADRSVKPGDIELKGKVLADSGTLLNFTCPVRVWDFPMPKLPHLAYMCEYRPFNDAGHYKNLWSWPIERQAKLFRANYRWYGRNRMQAGVVFPAFYVSRNEKNEWGIDNAEALKTLYPQLWKEFPGVFQVMWLRRWMVGAGTGYKDIATKDGQEKLASIQNAMTLFVAFAKKNNWPRERFIWYVGDEPICPHYTTRQQPIESINAYVKALRMYTGGMPIFASAWPFERDLLASVDIWSMRSTGRPLKRMPVEQAMNFGKAVALTLDNSDNTLMDRQAINYRIDPWHAWYAGVPMLEYGMNQYWQIHPWDPEENWWNAKRPVPGDMNLTYPPPSEDQVISCIRAELIREGMEDYEYFWLLRHASYVLRAAEEGGGENDLLRRIDECLWDAWQWIYNGSNRNEAISYIWMCANLKNDRIPELADQFDHLRSRMGETLQEVCRKGFFKNEAIDSGHKLPREWYKYDNP